MGTTVARMVFDTRAGFCGIGWSERGITRFCLPMSDRGAAERALARRTGDVGEAPAPPAMVGKRLLEDGSFRLLEDETSFRLLEDGVTTSAGGAVQTVIAQYYADKDAIDYTPSFAVADGDVIDLGDFIGVARRSIAAGQLGSLAIRGVFRFLKAPGETIARGDYVYWDGSQATGVIGYSSATIGRCVLDSADTDLYVRAFLTPGVG